MSQRILPLCRWNTRPIEDKLQAELDKANEALTVAYMSGKCDGKSAKSAEIEKLKLQLIQANLDIIRLEKRNEG
jgi:hypothetical protein